ncbi:MAG: hypothetical protein ACI376_02385 [Candidatus Bruticola sp.]
MRSFSILAAAISISTLGLFFSAPSEAEPSSYQVGQIVQTVRADLNGDHIPENISLKVFKTDEEGAFAKLVITDKQGRVLGKTPEVTSLDNPKIMGFFDWGVSKIHVAGPFNSLDAKILVAYPRSDVRPTVFGIWSWNSNCSTLTYEGNKCLLNYGSADMFRWEKPPALYSSGISWIDSLSCSSEQNFTITGSIVKYSDNTPPQVVKAELSPVKEGLKVKKILDK